MPVLHRFVAADGVLSRPPFPSRPLARVVDLAAGPWRPLEGAHRRAVARRQGGRRLPTVVPSLGVRGRRLPTWPPTPAGTRSN